MFSKSKAQKPSGSRRSSTMIALIIVPTVILFFVAGMFIGSKFVEGDFTDGQNAFTGNGADTGIRKGLPGTNNILNRWSEGNMKYLRGAAAEIVDIARRAEALVGLSPPAQVIDASKIEKVDVPGAVTVDEKKLVLEGLGRPMMPNSMYNSPPEVQHIVAGAHVPERHIVSGSQQMEELKMSLHATEHSFMKGPSNLDDANIIAGAWVYLDDTRQDNDMRTIFTNKKSGCENENEQYGLSMYVNAWQTNDHRLYVEYGGLESGCHKLDSGTVELHPKHWYHVAVHLGDDNAALFIDGTIVSTNGIGSVEKHQVQSTRPLLVGQYDDSAFPFYGNISHLAFIHCHADWTASTVGDVVKSMMDVKLVSKITGLHALYTLSDAVTETSGAVAVDTTHSYNGIYTFPLSRNSHRGVVIDLIDGTKDRVVTKEMKDEGDRLGRVRRENVKDGMKHAWKGYKDHAWGFDEILPLTRDGSDRWGGMGVTLVDSLDTLWIMGMKEEFKEARDWVANKLSFKHADTVSVFETTIRELGGLLAAFEFSGDAVFLEKAKELGDLLLPAFDTVSGIPRGQVSFRSDNNRMGDSTAVLSELGTLQVEFRYLSHHLKNLDLEKKAMKPLQMMHSKDPDHGLFPISINIMDGSFADTHITLGALGDSFYEYLLKVWIQGGKKETWLREMYDKAVDGVIDILLEASSKTGLAFISDWTGTANVRKMDHLVCFLPGVMALGAHTDPRGSDSVRAKRDLAVAKALMHTCHEMYTRQSSGIAPEFVDFPERGDMSVSSAPFYILRPETAESLFVLNQITGDPMYRDWAWGIWENINKHCRTDTAYAALRDVNNPALGVDNRMESFFLAETLKYLYLALDPDNTIDLDVYVINTEAHPMRIFDDSHVPVPAS